MRIIYVGIVSGPYLVRNFDDPFQVCSKSQFPPQLGESVLISLVRALRESRFIPSEYVEHIHQNHWKQRPAHGQWPS
jgi:hypothetical protein